MIKICFVCLGNICRSPMAEFIMKKKVNELGLSENFYIVSKATSYEEEGNDIYPLAKQKLIEEQIPYTKHCATRLEETDYSNYDYFICMEASNIKNTVNIFGGDPDNKIFRLLELSEYPKDIADPWYTRNFDETYNDLNKGIDLLIRKLIKK